MATLRQTEIDEILNNDRTMNRKVLDRTIAQVQSFNDERSAPNTQDIKLEAIVGSLVDKLKASIADALKLIALKQFPQVTSSNAPVILNTPAGQSGMTANNPNQAQLSQLDDNQGSYKGPKIKGDGKAFETAILKAKKRDYEENDDDNQGYRFTSPLATSYEKRMSDDLEYLEDDEDNEDNEDLDGGYCGGYCGGVGFGMKRRKRGLKGAGPNDAKSTMRTSADRKSVIQTENTVENVLYDIINQYNGIVDMILQATRDGGVLKNKRLASASIVSFFSNILQGLIEPLKHLLYELALVKDKDIASMWTMMKSMVDSIQSAPPFQKVDFRVYRTPTTDYQRLNRDLRIDDYSGKLASMKKDGSDLEASLKRLHKDASHIEYAMQDKSDGYKREMKARLLQKQKDIKQAISQHNEDVAYVEKRKKSGLPYDAEALKDTTRDILTKGKVLPVVSAVLTGATLQSPLSVSNLRGLVKTQEGSIQELESQQKALEQKAKTEVLTEGDEELVKAITITADSLKQHINLLLEKVSVSDDAVFKDFEKQYKAQYYKLDAVEKKLNATYSAIKSKKEEEEKGDEGEEGDEEEGAPPAPVEGVGKPMSGYGKPLADLLANRRQQYNSMGRPISNDDKIHKQVVKQNIKWQVSNPVHTTPIGSKNPFYAQAPDAKYDFRTVLGKENSTLYPKKNALGADVSLLQGAIGGPTEEAKQKRQYKKAVVETRTEADALRNILNQNIYEGGSKKKSGALRKLVFDDDDNDLFDGEELPVNKGFIKEDKDDKFKLPDVKKEQAKKRQGRL